MKEFNAKTDKTTTASALSTVLDALHNDHDYALYVALDVHKDTIAVALANPGRGEPQYHGEIANQPKKVARLLERLSQACDGAPMLFCYEAGPCGYVLYHQIIATGHECQVIAPSLVASKPGERVKTDRRDALKLARQLRAGDLTQVWVPDQEQEAMRDLTRARDDMKAQEHRARQQLNGFVLRHGHHWPSDQTRWTGRHYKWLESITFDHRWQQAVMREYIDAARAATERVNDLTARMTKALPEWSLAPVVYSLMAMRGIAMHSAMVLMAELGDISRFDSPSQLMAYLGLVPSEHSSGERRRQGKITRTGNSRARRTLVESAWCYRFPARQTAHLKRKAVNASDQAKKIAWKAQKRLCGRYRTMIEAGKNSKLVCVAIARELAGFIWDLVRHEMPTVPSASA